MLTSYTPYLCEACFYIELQKMSRDGTVHKIDLDRAGKRERIYRVGRVPEGSDSDEEMKVKPNEKYRRPRPPTSGGHWWKGPKRFGP